MAQEPTVFAFWYPDNITAGGIRYLTPNECEWLQGLPTDWTAQGVQGEAISDNARYQAIGNAIALPCAEYIMAGIQEVLNS